MMSTYNAERMLADTTITKGRGELRREGDFWRVTCPNGYRLRVPAHREDIARHLAGGGPMSWPPKADDPTIGAPPSASTGKRAASRSGFSAAQIDMLGDMLRPLLRPLLEAKTQPPTAKATSGPAKTRTTKDEALGRLAGIQARVAVLAARATAAQRMAT